MKNIDNIQNGDVDIFLDLFDSEIKSIIRENQICYILNFGGNKRELWNFTSYHMIWI